MAIGTYAQLKTAVENFLHLSSGVSYTDRIPEWIDLAEAEINRKIRVFRQQKWATASYTGTSSRLLALPSGFIEILGVNAKLSTDDDLDYHEVRYVAPQMMVARYNDTQGRPRSFTVRRSDLEFDRKAGSDTFTIRMHYLGTWDIASDSTNWLLTNHPDVYLYGALVSGEQFNFNDARMPMWQRQFRDAITQVNMVDDRTRDDATLDTSEVTHNSYRYRTGYDINTDEAP